MPARKTSKKPPRSKSRARRGSRSRRRSDWPRLWPSAQTRRRWWRWFLTAPFEVQLATTMSVVIVLWLTLNFGYQIFRKPSELFFPISDTFLKTPEETWASYSGLFRKHSTTLMTPEFLAALAQVEASGNPIVRTYWRWAWRSNPFEVYRPASSAVGMYQITDGTFAQARRYCIHDHRVVEDGPWNDWDSCWFNALYTRTVPSHAVEMTSAYLDRNVSDILSRHRIKRASLAQKQDLAAVIHLCGAGAGSSYARRGFRFAPGQHCGDHHTLAYVARVNAMKRLFAKKRAAQDST